MKNENYINRDFSIYIQELPEDVIHIPKYNDYNIDIYYSFNENACYKQVHYKFLKDNGKPYFKQLKYMVFGHNDCRFVYVTTVDTKKQIHVGLNRLRQIYFPSLNQSEID